MRSCPLPEAVPAEVHADIDAKAKAAGFDGWFAQFKNKVSWSLNPDLPAITPWKTVNPINTPNWTLERNPYSIWVDTDGNQLPYIDKVSLTLGENLEVINLKAIAGEFDEQARHIDIGKLPVLLENQKKGNYKLVLDTADFGADCGLKFNLSYEGDAEIGKWFRTVDFRRALALGVDRDQINETFWLGAASRARMCRARPTSTTPALNIAPSGRRSIRRRQTTCSISWG